MSRVVVVALAFIAALVGFQCAFAADPPAAAGRKVVLISGVAVDPKVHAPESFSADILRREMEVALESTGLFTATTRDKAELQAVVRELKVSGRRPAGIQKADLILFPTVEGIDIAERRRQAPMMSGKDSVSVRGTLSLTVEVVDVRNGGVQTRMPVDLVYETAEHLADPMANDQLADPAKRHQAVNLPPSPEELKAAYEAFGRDFAKRVLDQVDPVRVALRNGDQVFLTRGEDAGYHIGDRLRIMRLGQKIIDPVTHEVLDVSDSQIGELKVTEVRPRVTVATIVSSTSDVAAGDIVRDPIPPPSASPDN